MSVVIVGGNECMTRQYKDMCESYQYKAKIYPKMSTGLIFVQIGEIYSWA
ncbi:MAG: DUF2325 domain-containing protein [Oscillospiraceae bacterium]|nr:DUF2325 domain-containing protein [Oscillospiraceae bacterium]